MMMLMKTTTMKGITMMAMTVMMKMMMTTMTNNEEDYDGDDGDCSDVAINIIFIIPWFQVPDRQQRMLPVIWLLLRNR
jgi:ABC-type cobalt transport system substrate-binding protein